LQTMNEDAPDLARKEYSQESTWISELLQRQ
jgi:hypothetical protein